MNIPIHSIDKVKSFSNDLKDKLVAIYNFIDRESQKETPLFQFDEISVLRAYWSLRGHWADETFAKTFIANIDSVKMLVTSQPIHVVEFTKKFIGEDGEECVVKHTEEYKCYDLTKRIKDWEYNKVMWSIIKVK
jgi:hypothetical protein